MPVPQGPRAAPGRRRSARKRRVASFLSAGLLAATVVLAAVLAATPAQAFHRYHHRHFPPGPAYDYGPAWYPPVVVAPSVIAGPLPYPPVVVAPPVYAAPPAPVMAGPLPSPVPAAPYPAAEAAYATGPVPPGPDRMEGTPDCLVVREYTAEIEVGGEPVEGYGYACLKADGSWQRGAPVPVR